MAKVIDAVVRFKKLEDATAPKDDPAPGAHPQPLSQARQGRNACLRKHMAWAACMLCMCFKQGPAGSTRHEVMHSHSAHADRGTPRCPRGNPALRHAAVYLLDEILDMSRRSPQDAQEIAESVNKKLGHRSPVVKFKVAPPRRLLLRACCCSTPATSTTSKAGAQHDGGWHQQYHYPHSRCRRRPPPQPPHQGRQLTLPPLFALLPAGAAHHQAPVHQGRLAVPAVHAALRTVGQVRVHAGRQAPACPSRRRWPWRPQCGCDPPVQGPGALQGRARPLQGRRAERSRARVCKGGRGGELPGGWRGARAGGGGGGGGGGGRGHSAGGGGELPRGWQGGKATWEVVGHQLPAKGWR